MMLKAKTISIERWWDVWVAGFAMGIIIIVASRLWITEWTSDLYLLVYLAVLAGLTGLALGYSQFSPLVSAFISTYYGIFCIGWLFGTTIDLDITWRERILNYLGWRLRIAIEQFSAGQAVTDPLLFLTIMAILLWIMASTATFILIRQGSAWSILVPLGITLLVISHYDQNLSRNTGFLMSFIFFTLLILGRVNFLQYRNKWVQEGIHVTRETHADLTKALVVLALVLVILAWLVPITPQQMSRYAQVWERVTDPWDRFRERFADLLVLETATDTAMVTFFGETLGLGTGSPISEEIVFTVEVETAPPAGYRNYWRTRSYDRYENEQWSSTPGLIRTMRFPDDFNIAYPQWVDYQSAAYTFTTQIGRMGNLYVTGLPTWISRPVQTVTQPLFETEEDLVALVAQPEVFAGESYQVETLVSRPTASDLRQTGTDYPEWLDRYLQLPDDFSPEVAALAENISARASHPYDIAVDITRYLRINIEYARTIPPVPPGADPMEWFLFDEQVGFCNYYATAQVLMLRSLGIPARFVVGYAEGEYDRQTRTYTVRKEDSHAWPEVYFMDYGWVPFEPTGSQPALILPAGFDPTAIDNDLADRDTPIMEDDFEDPLAELDEILNGEQDAFEEMVDLVPRRFEGILVVWVMLILFLLVLLLGITILIRPALFKINIDPLPVLVERLLMKNGKTVPVWLQRWSHLASMSHAEKAYRHLCRSIKIMGQALNPAQTPSERAQTLTRLIPQAYQPALEIVHEYHVDQFSTHMINEELAKAAGRRVLVLALETRLRRLFEFGQRK
jgi:transglutaminase-like putative cysteine protease